MKKLWLLLLEQQKNDLEQGSKLKKILHRNLRVIPKFSRKFENFSRKSNQPKQNIKQVFRQLLTS